jgi:hypothetical protein
MQLPIEYPAPQKDKYIEEETTVFNRWMIFGIHPETGNVDISDGDQDIITNVPKDRADKILEVRNMFVNTMLELLR